MVESNGPRPEAIAKSDWKKVLEKVSALLVWWRKQYPHDTELDWLFYSGRRAFLRDRPNTCGKGIRWERQLQSLERLMNNHSKSQNENKKGSYDLFYHRRNGAPLTVNRILPYTGYPVNPWPSALTIHWVTKGRTKPFAVNSGSLLPYWK